VKQENIINALKELPEVHLSIFQLAREVYQDGDLDMDKAAFLRKEIDEAVKEAESYAQATREAVWALTKNLS